MAELNKDKATIENKIKKIDKELKPMEREHFWLEVAKWSLVLAEIFLMFLAAVLASTIIFLFIIPLAPAVWLSAKIPAVAREAVDLKISDLEKKMEKQKKERTDEEKKLEEKNKEIKKLARERFKLINQTPFARNKRAA